MPASVTGTRALKDSSPTTRDDRSAGDAWLAGGFVGMQQGTAGFPGNAPRSLSQPFRGASPQTGQASSR